MPFAGITYKVKPGFDDEIAWIFSPENFTRVDSPILRDPDGAEIGYLTCTGLFIQDDTMIRVIQHDGGCLADIRRHMSVQDGVHDAERQLVPYLAAARDTSTPEGFMAHFDRSTMTVLDLQQVDNRPAAGLIALRYRIRPTPAIELARAYAAAPQRLALLPGGPVVAVLLLAKDDTVVRVLQYEDHTAEEVIEYLRALPPDAATDAWLAPFTDEPDAQLDDVRAHVDRHRMRCVSHLSAAVTG
jgi:hypothetical protein